MRSTVGIIISLIMISIFAVLVGYIAFVHIGVVWISMCIGTLVLCGFLGLLNGYTSYMDK